MSKYSAFLKIFFLITLYGCGYNQVTSKPEIYSSVSITFDKSIPIPMVAKLKSTFDTNADSDAISVSIKNYSMKKYNVYGGNALRALEGELTLKTQIMIQEFMVYLQKKRLKLLQLIRERLQVVLLMIVALLGA